MKSSTSIAIVTLLALASGPPQVPQNFCPAGLGAWHFGHALTSTISVLTRPCRSP